MTRKKTHLDIHWHHAALTLCSISVLLSGCKLKDVMSDNNPLETTKQKIDNGMWSSRTICKVRKEAVDMYNVQKDLWMWNTVLWVFTETADDTRMRCSHRISLKTLFSSLHSPSINIINMLQLTDIVMPPQQGAWWSLSYFFPLKNNKRISSFRNVNISASSLCIFVLFCFILVTYEENHKPQPPPKSHISHSPLG